MPDRYSSWFQRRRSMDIRSLLQANNDKLLQLYKENLDITTALQATLIDEVLPHVRYELQLDADAVDRANEWLGDTGEFAPIPSGWNWYLILHLASIFQFLRVCLDYPPLF